MTLTLSIRNVPRLDNGMPGEYVLHRRGAMIGRSPTCDWSLPDPRNYISSRHCEIIYRDNSYSLVDVSTNGTFLNGAAQRMDGPRRIEQGDLFLIGHYEMVAALSGEAMVAVERDEEAAAQAAQAGGWTGWGSHGGDAPPSPDAAADTGWGTPPASGGGWGSAAAPLDTGWADAPAAPASGGGDWGPAAPPAPPSDAGWGAPAGSDNSGWAAPAAGSADAPSWAPRSGPSLARDPAHRAHAAGTSPSAPADPLGSSGGWTPAPRAPQAPVASTWEQAIPAAQQASGWSSAAPDRPREASPEDVWGSMAQSNVVDWARGGFGHPVEAARDPLGLDKPQPAASLPKAPPPQASGAAPITDAGWGAGAGDANAGWGAAAPAAPGADSTPQPAAEEWSWKEPEPAVATPPAPPPASAAPPRPAPGITPAPAPQGADLDGLLAAFATAAGLKPEQIRTAAPAAVERAGMLLRRLVAGLVVMVEARARAKSQMGAEQTGLEFEGNNPLKFARTTDQALAQLLNPPERGFMPAERAIEDAYFDLQSHQMATLKAMQGALRVTLDRFSPTAIKKRAESGGFMSRLLPGGREATLWATYEREFSGVAQGSDEAFMDVFAKEFRQAYDEQSRNRKRQG